MTQVGKGAKAGASMKECSQESLLLQLKFIDKPKSTRISNYRGLSDPSKYLHLFPFAGVSGTRQRGDASVDFQLKFRGSYDDQGYKVFSNVAKSLKFSISKYERQKCYKKIQCYKD